jgi:hypothetical protein
MLQKMDEYAISELVLNGKKTLLALDAIRLSFVLIIISKNSRLHRCFLFTQVRTHNEWNRIAMRVLETLVWFDRPLFLDN